MAKKTDDELSSILEQPENRSPEALEAARAELKSRNIDPDSIKLAPTDARTDELPDEPPAGEMEEKEEGIETVAEKKIRYRRQAIIGIGTAFGLDFAARMLTSSNSSQDNSVVFGIGLVSWGFFLWGCANCAAAKGYTKWLGALGLLCCIGLLILILLPDRRKGFDDPKS